MKALKYAALVAGPIALIVGVIIFADVFGSSGTMPNSVRYVDVLSGKTTTFDRRNPPVSVPAPNDDGTLAMYPVAKDDTGNWSIVPRYRDHLRANHGKDTRLIVDLDSFTLKDPL